jgi:RNA methyltransferase, TrmH family
MRKATAHHGSNNGGRLRRIESAQNHLVKDLRKAFAHGGLEADHSCAIEGFHILEEAIRSGLKFRAIFFSAAAESKADRWLQQMAARVETILLPDHLFNSVVPSETPQGVAALVVCKAFTLEDVLAKSTAGPLLGVAGVQDPGNLGTILRSAKAFDAGGVLLGTGTASPFNSKAVRASAGSVFQLPLARVALAEALDALREHGLRLMATSSRKGTPLPEANLGGPLALFIGNEGAGVPRELLARMDETIMIPHSARVESLNAGVAASILLYEVARQRQFHGRKETAPLVSAEPDSLVK